MYGLTRLVTSVAMFTLPSLCEASRDNGAEARGSSQTGSAPDDVLVPAAPVARLPVPRASVGASPQPSPTPAETVVEFDALLDLVPADQPNYLAVRDPSAILQLVAATVGVSDPGAIAGLFDQLDPADVRRHHSVLSAFEEAIAASTVELEQGLLFTSGNEVLVFKASDGDPWAFANALRSAGIAPRDLPKACVTPPKLGGYSACGDDEALLKALQPGMRGSGLQVDLVDNLPTFDVHNSAGALRTDRDGTTVFAAVAVEGTHLHLAFSGPTDLDEFRFSVPNNPSGVGLAAANTPFVWSAFPAELLGKLAAEMPEGDLVVESLSGELLAGATPNGALFALLGVNDPFPASGLVSLGALAAPQLRKQLPSGSLIDVERIETHDGPAQALRVRYESGPVEELARSFGLPATAHALSAGEYAGVVLGASSSGVASVANYRAKGASLPPLPQPLAKALASGDCFFAAYLPLDPLHNTETRERFLAALHGAKVFDALDPGVVTAALQATKPLSSASTWVTGTDHFVYHLAVDTFGDTTTAEGREALAALGRTPAEDASSPDMATLAKTHSASSRAHRYTQRLDDGPSNRATALAAAGLVATAVHSPSGKRKRHSRSAPKRPRPASPKKRQLPLAEIKKNGIYTPDPDPRKLAALGFTKPGTAKVAFCVSSSGKVENVRSTKRYLGGRAPKMDQLLRSAVSNWRFKPFIVGGRPMKTCSTAVFNLRFD